MCIHALMEGKVHFSGSACISRKGVVGLKLVAILKAENMGRRKGWFSAIKSIFVLSYRKYPPHESWKQGKSEDRGIVNPRHLYSESLIPRFREPSSIEKILIEADKLSIRPTTSYEDDGKKDRPAKFFDESAFSPKGVGAPLGAASAETARSFRRIQRTEPSPRIRYIYATKIQAAFRGYMARKSIRSLRALLRLQRAVRGHNTKLQNASAMTQMHNLTRIQLQIYSMRIRKQKNHQTNRQNDRELESTLSRWSLNRGHWDDSLLFKEEKELRSWRKTEATVKRERAIANSQSHKANQASMRGHQKLRSKGYSKWWNWVEMHLPSPAAKITRDAPSINKYQQSKPPYPDTSQLRRNTVGGARYNPSLRDDESITSCPVLLKPSYMIHTASSRAKARENGHNDANLEKNTPSYGEKPNRRPEKPLRRKSIGDMSVDSFLSLPC